jgi:hypothetical protein
MVDGDSYDAELQLYCEAITSPTITGVQENLMVAFLFEEDGDD